MSEEILNAVIGTAGHIDHGKSSLVKALTQIDPDRLPEEKERAMTIDIGFANMKLKDGKKIGIIDVPGHEDFIKNMLAGATGVDFVILVVAANEGVMPQTIEHMRIMQLLGLKSGVVALTKIDIADEEMAELVEEDIKTLTKGTFLEKAPVIRVNSIKGEGIIELFEQINDLIEITPRKNPESIFRMYIQRVFTKKGFGAVITGVPVSGKLNIHDEIEIVQHRKSYKVKNLQAYMSNVDTVSAGHSSAINLIGCDYTTLKRGFTAATPGYYGLTTQFEVQFNYLSDAAKFLPSGMIKLKSGFPIKFYIGTQEADGKIILLETRTLEPGETALAQIRLDEPIVIQDGDRYIIRTQTPTFTIGGGIAVRTSQQKKIKRRGDLVNYLQEKLLYLNDNKQYTEFILKEQTGRFMDLQTLSRLTHLLEEELVLITGQIKDNLFFPSRDKFAHKEALQRSKATVIETLNNFHKTHPLRSGMTDAALKYETDLEDAFYKKIVNDLLEQNEIIRHGTTIRLNTFQPKLSREEESLRQEIEQLIRSKGLATPKHKELAAIMRDHNSKKIDTIINLLVEAGIIIYLKDGILIHRETLEETKEKLREAFSRETSLEPAKIRDVLGTTRKYIIPLIEYLDSIRFTKRDGNKRILYEK